MRWKWENFMEDRTIILAVIPIVIVYLVLLILALRDWIGRTKYRYLSKWLWLVIILCFSLVGPVSYFILGRMDDRG